MEPRTGRPAGHAERDWSLEAPGTLSSVGWEVVGVQVIVACALGQAVVSVQKGLWLVNGLQVVVRLVGLCLEQAAGQSGRGRVETGQTLWHNATT